MTISIQASVFVLVTHEGPETSVVKRYRPFLFDWDSAGDLLNQEIDETWPEGVVAAHRKNRERMITSLTRQYGETGIEDKLANLQAIGGQAFSVVAYHNRFYKQARDAFIVGAYYPALTAACALGERILNHLILGLRDSYRDEPGYDEFATVKSSSNWRKMIPTLESWDVLLPGAVTEYRNLLELRNRAIHFNPATAERDREMAVDALRHLGEIIAIQFGVFRNQPWFIPGTRGVQFISKEWEDNPFVRLIYIPASFPVGPNHRIEIDEAGTWTVYDQSDYEDREITDSEYVQVYADSIQYRMQHFNATEEDPAD